MKHGRVGALEVLVFEPCQWDALAELVARACREGRGRSLAREVAEALRKARGAAGETPVLRRQGLDGRGRVKETDGPRPALWCECGEGAEHWSLEAEGRVQGHCAACWGK